MTRTSSDAVIIGAGHHGLVAAAVLADAGWDVVVLEGQDEVGGAVRSREGHPGFTVDRFSAFYPLGAASPVIRGLDLAAHGLRWVHAPSVVAHPHGADDEVGALVHRDPQRTADALGEDAAADRDAWLRLVEQWQAIRDPLLDTLLTAWPPVGSAIRLLSRLGTADALRLARFATLPATRMGEELFAGELGRRLLAGNAMHADAPIDGAISGTFGWLLLMLGQDVGFPVPAGGAGQLAEALRRRAVSAGAQVVTGDAVTEIVVSGGRAVGVRTCAGHEVAARRAVLADVPATALYGALLPEDVVPARLRDDLTRFDWDLGTVKIDYALSAPAPWRAAAAHGAGTVHVGADLDEDGRPIGAVEGLVRWNADLRSRRVPRAPFGLVGQMTTTDPSRSPAGTESMWAYTHVPSGLTGREVADQVAANLEDVLERHAPGFRDLVLDRVVQRPRDLQDDDANLVGGAVNGGTAQLHQQLVFRPTPGPGGARTVVDRLYLASAATHPGGGVHGGCGYLAARAALRDAAPVLGPLRRRSSSALLDLVYRSPR